MTDQIVIPDDSCLIGLACDPRWDHGGEWDCITHQDAPFCQGDSVNDDETLEKDETTEITITTHETLPETGLDALTLGIMGTGMLIAGILLRRLT